eukprot:12522790-Ditylum_brightwellii.AAC.1
MIESRVDNEDAAEFTHSFSGLSEPSATSASYGPPASLGPFVPVSPTPSVSVYSGLSFFPVSCGSFGYNVVDVPLDFGSLINTAAMIQHGISDNDFGSLINAATCEQEDGVSLSDNDM